MKTRWVVAIGLTLLMGSALAASAQMMGGGTGMMGHMGMTGRGMHESADTGCPGMVGGPAAFGAEGPWISLALAHTRELDLTVDQAKGLTALGDEFQREALRLIAEIRAAEADLQVLYGHKLLDLRAVEAKIRAIAALQADLRLGRVTTLEKGSALLTPEQRQKLSKIAESVGRMHGASMMGGPPGVSR